MDRHPGRGGRVGHRGAAGRLSVLPSAHHRALLRAAHACADRVRAALHRRPARLHRRLARHTAGALRQWHLALRDAVRAGSRALLLRRARALGRRPLRLVAGRPRHGPLRARCREPGRGCGRLGRHRRDAGEAEDHGHFGRDVRGRRGDLRAVSDVCRAGHDRGRGRLAEHRVRRDRGRHVGDARADGRRGVHAGALRSAARVDPELGARCRRSSAPRCSRSTR